MTQRELVKPLLVYDGDCGFCRLWIARWQSFTGNRIEYAPFQEVAERFPQIPREDFERSVQLLMPGGDIYQCCSRRLSELSPMRLAKAGCSGRIGACQE